MLPRECTCLGLPVHSTHILWSVQWQTVVTLPFGDYG